MQWPWAFRRAVTPQSTTPLRLLRIGELKLDTRAGRATADGGEQPARVGCWMFYLPALEAKLFHADSGRIDCIHRSRPDAAELQGPDREMGRYRVDDWRNALATPLARRLAELWLVSARLWKAGLGPRPLGVCFVDRVVRDGRALGPTCGILSRNVCRMPRKLKGTLEQVRQAGVIPDRVLSSVRRQVRGYVIDLCSVVGCMPADAEKEVIRLETCLENPPTDALLLAELDATLR